MIALAEGTVTCVIADDHPPVLEFLSRYLANQGMTVTASTRNGDEALQKIRANRPEVAIVDARMPVVSGLDVARAIAREELPTRVVLYTGYGDEPLLTSALELGVGALLDKEAPIEDLVRAIRIVAAGGTYVDPGLGAILLRPTRPQPLTGRERDVLTALADGLGNDAVGARLGISPQTVRTHVQKAMEKLGAATRTEAVATALRRALIE